MGRTAFYLESRWFSKGLLVDGDRELFYSRAMQMAASKGYWLVVITLFGVSAFFAFRVEHFRQGLKKGTGKLCLKHNDVAMVKRVMDGDELLVKKEGCVAVIRILGIKTFDPVKAEPLLKPFGQRAVARLKRLIGEKVTVVGPKLILDSRGWIIARVSSEGKDMGRELIRMGYALAYTKYPFKQLSDYLVVEGQARVESRGLWAEPAAVSRASALKAAWKRERKQ